MGHSGTDDLDVGPAVAELDAALRAAGTPQRAEQEKRYLKSDLVHYGATMPAIRRVVTAWSRQHPALTGVDLRELCGALWARGVHELRMAAVELLVLRVDTLVPGRDVPWLEPLLRDARTWALVDPLAAQVVGPLADRDPDAADPLLARWAVDDDVWLRRTVLLRFLLPLRRGEAGAFAPFAAYADAMLEDRSFWIRKAIGWVLREAGKRAPDEVAAWLEPRLGRAAGLTVREAVKRLPDERRDALLAAHREGRGRRTGGRARSTS